MFSKAAYPASTEASYKTAVNWWFKVCKLLSKSIFDVTEDNVILFVAYLATKEKKIQYSTIGHYLSGMAQFCAQNNLAHPRRDRYHLFRVMRGIKLTLGNYVNQARPVELTHLVALLPWLDPQNSFHCALWGAMILSFYGMLRKTEVSLPKGALFDPEVHLTRSSVVVTGPVSPNQQDNGHIRLRLRKSKTIPKGSHMDVYLPAIPGAASCPFQAISLTLASAPNKSPDAPLFQNQDGSVLRHDIFLSEFRRLMSLADPATDLSEWAGNSFRAGGCSAAFAAGLPPYLIKLHGRWRSEAYLFYAHLDLGTRLSVARAMSSYELSSSNASSPIFDSFYSRMKYDAI